MTRFTENEFELLLRRKSIISEIREIVDELKIIEFLIIENLRQLKT